MIASAIVGSRIDGADSGRHDRLTHHAPRTIDMLRLTARHAVRLAVAGAVSVLAACDSDPAGPHFGPPNAQPSAGRQAPGENPLKLPVTATLRIVSVAASGDSMSIPGTSFNFRASGSNFEILVADNGPNDGDDRVGYYKVKLPIADEYQAWVGSIPAGYASFGLTTVTPRTGMSAAFGSLVAKTQPILNITTLLETTRELTMGRTVRITSPTGFDATITDGGPTDLGAGPSEKPYLLDGKIRLRLNNQGEYTICEVNSLAATPSCVKLFATWGGSYSAALPVANTGVVM